MLLTHYKKGGLTMEEIAETLINNINNVIKVLNDTESCERVEELKLEIKKLEKIFK